MLGGAVMVLIPALSYLLLQAKPARIQAPSDGQRKGFALALP
jgi:hypothetical protein